MSSLDHLAAHHGDFKAFCRLMQDTAAGRFGPAWWGVWQQYVAPSLPADGTVVDLGCGPGGLFESLRQMHPQVRIIGVELQPAMLTAAYEAATTHRAEILEADLAAPLPLADASVDTVVAAMVLHELPTPTLVLAEAWRILRPGGTVLVYDWCKQPLRTYAAGRALDVGLLQHFREHCLYTPDDLSFLCEHAGFDVQEVIGRRTGHYAMIALRKP